MIDFVLASASPARLATLRAVGISPRVIVSDVDEDAAVAEAQCRHGHLEPADVALLLAQAKAEAVSSSLRARGDDGALILGCDSVLELDGDVHGKPENTDVAVQRWHRMRGRSGVLHTGHWLIDDRDPDQGGSAATFGATASTTVHFAQVTDTEIQEYVATGEPLRVAGAFTLDGLGAPFVAGIEGDPSNVVGVSVPLLRELLAEIEVGWFSLVQTPGAGKLI